MLVKCHVTTTDVRRSTMLYGIAAIRCVAYMVGFGSDKATTERGGSHIKR
jgi:hypothetical protein